MKGQRSLYVGKWPIYWSALSKCVSPALFALLIAHCSFRYQATNLIELIVPSSGKLDVKQFPLICLNIESVKLY